MVDSDLHKLLLDAATGCPDALKRLRVLVNYGECIEKAFVAVERPPLRLIRSGTDPTHTERAQGLT